MGLTRRQVTAPIIAGVIQANKGKDIKEIKKALREAYPFGIRKYHPYRIWCDEIRVQLGLKKKKPIVYIPDERQLALFN